MVEHLRHAFAADLRIRQHTTESLPARGAALDAEVVDAGGVYDDAGVRVTAFPVDHGHVTPAFGYRVDQGERSVVISGDTPGGRRV
jgi:ribonuclease Z